MAHWEITSLVLRKCYISIMFVLAQVCDGKWWFQLGFSLCLFPWLISASAAPGSVCPAADEKHNLPLSVFSIVSVPLFNWNLTILAFDTFIVFANSNKIYVDTEYRGTTQNIEHRKSISRSMAGVRGFPSLWRSWVKFHVLAFSGTDLGSFLVDLCNYCFAISEQKHWNSQAVWAKSKQLDRFLLVGISSPGLLYSQGWCISVSVML